MPLWVVATEVRVARAPPRRAAGGGGDRQLLRRLCTQGSDYAKAHG